MSVAADPDGPHYPRYVSVIAAALDSARQGPDDSYGVALSDVLTAVWRTAQKAALHGSAVANAITVAQLRAALGHLDGESDHWPVMLGVEDNDGEEVIAFAYCSGPDPAVNGDGTGSAYVITGRRV